MDITEKLNRKLFFILLSILLHLVKNSHPKKGAISAVSPPFPPPSVEGIFFSYDSDIFVSYHSQI